MDMQRMSEIGPVFLAETKSRVSDDYHKVVEMIESMLVFVFRGLQERNDQEEAALDRHSRSIREFNSQANPDNAGLSNTLDTITGGREVCSGSQRINPYNELFEAMRAGVCGPPLDLEAEEWHVYLTALRLACLGIEVVAWVQIGCYKRSLA
ncbi:MAG: hypothetical protein LQ342_007294 [Letrouitia transgressa]|nr:MAG: hypothetical protein LQ342_007294 [Letrouitia transgressa]